MQPTNFCFFVYVLIVIFDVSIGWYPSNPGLFKASNTIGFVIDFISIFSGSDSNTIVGAGHTTAENDNAVHCRYIQRMIVAFSAPNVDDNDHTLAVISDDENIGDTLTITSASGTPAHSVLIFGYGAEGNAT